VILRLLSIALHDRYIQSSALRDFYVVGGTCAVVVRGADRRRGTPVVFGRYRPCAIPNAFDLLSSPIHKASVTAWSEPLRFVGITHDDDRR
jgi:hypothetical protein